MISPLSSIRIARRCLADFYARQACIIIVTDTKEGKFLVKNRDRNYKPKLKVIHEVIAGVEVCYVKDMKTGWCEGLNEHGIGIVNSALQVGRDEAEVEVVRQVGKKRKDGERILNALEAKTLKDAVDRLMDFKGGLKGHTFVATKDEAFSIEVTSKHDGFKTKLKDGRHVRTNHGFHYEDSGYTEGEDYVSSVARRDQAVKAIKSVKDSDELAQALMDGRKKDRHDPNNKVRDTDNMRSTSIRVLNLNTLILDLYVIPGKIDFLGVENKLPKGSKPRIQVRVHEFTGKDNKGLKLL